MNPLSFLRVLFGLVTAIGLAVVSSLVQADPLPGGSYQQSCRNLSADGGTLRGECRTRGGNWTGTRLDNIHQCVGDIDNEDGQLRCSRGAAPPRGSYSGSCRDIWFASDTLHAGCADRAHGWSATSLGEISQCRGDIANMNGQLHCDKGAPAPPGSYRQSCRDIVHVDGTLRASCQDRNGAWIASTLNDPYRCVGDIANMDGVLRCNRGGSTPPGSYQRACRDIRVSGINLFASCRDSHGAWIPGSLDNYAGCVGDIFDFEGRLACRRGAMPTGSYTLTCVDAWLDGDTLLAHCSSAGGGVIPAALDRAAGCVAGTVENRNGGLVCDRGDRPAPAGSYRQSCSDAALSGTTLSANCRLPDGASMGARLDTAGCRGDIANIYGHLACAKGNGDPPPGRYRSSCIEVRMTGNVLSASCRTSRGNWLPTSFIVQGNCPSVDNAEGRLRCTSPQKLPPPAPADAGYKDIQFNNCNQDTGPDDQHRPVSVWFFDVTVNGGEGWRRVGHLPAQYASNGQCPFDEGGQPIDPDTLELVRFNGWNDQHWFNVKVVDPGMPACGGQDDPNAVNCVRYAFRIKANKDGESFTLRVN